MYMYKIYLSLVQNLRPSLWNNQPPIKWVTRVLGRPGRESDHSSPFTDQAKNDWSFTSAPAIRLRGVKETTLRIYCHNRD